jgi:hypothetical protein
MRSEELTFNKSGQWKLDSLDKGVNTLGGTPDDSI